MKKKFIRLFSKNKQNGYVLPYVMMISTLIIFMLTHQISLYTTELKFYKESSELHKMDRLLQKATVDLQNIVNNTKLIQTDFQYEEGKATISIDRKDPLKMIVQIQVVTNEERKSMVIVHYDSINRKITKWIEGR